MSRMISIFALSAATLAASAGLARAQALDFAGVHHEPLGGAVLTPSADGSLVVGHLGAASAGVDVVYQTESGLETSCDLSELFRTPGAVMRTKYKGWDGTIKGRFEMRCGTPGRCDTTCDFSTLRDATGASVRSLHWIVRDLIGNEIASGDVTGPTKSFIIIPPPPMSPAGVSEPMVWNLRTRVNQLEQVLKNFGILARSESGPFTVQGLAPIPIEHAGSVEIFPIICITSPCPGGWNNVSSVNISASGLPSQSLKLQPPRVVRWDDPPALCGDTTHFRSVPCVGLGDVSMVEGCDMPPPIACAPVDTALHITNIGSSGQDGVSIRFDEAESLRSGIVHRDIAAFAGEARVVCTEMPGAIGEVVADWKAAAPYGHVTVLKLSCTPGSSVGGAMIFADATGIGAQQCRIECVDASGAVIASTVCPPNRPVRCLQPLGGDVVFHTSCNAFGVSQVQCPSGEVLFPDGTQVSGVTSFYIYPDSVTDLRQSISRCDVTATNVAALSVDGIHYTGTEIAGGIACVPLNGSCVRTVDNGVAISPPAGSTTASAEFITNSDLDGGLSLNLQQLLSSGGRIKIRHRGWDGLIYHRTTLSSPPGSNVIIEDVDFSGFGVEGIDWTLRGDGGEILATGRARNNEICRWEISCPPGTVAPSRKDYVYGGETGSRRAHEGFFDVAVTVSGLTTTPVDGVRSIEIDPIECAACPEMCSRTRSFELEADGIPDLVVGDPMLSMTPMVHQGGSNWNVVAQGIGGAYVGVNERLPDTHLHVSNIGSSGNDGVEVRYFETGDRPTQQQFYSLLDSFVSSGWGGGGGGGSWVCAEYRSVCPQCTDGHVTVLKLTETREGGMSWFHPDFSAVGAAGFEFAALNASGNLIDSSVHMPEDRFATSMCDGSVSVGCDSTGLFSFRPCSSTCILPDGTVRNDVALITMRPVGTTATYPPASIFRLTGRSVGAMTFLSSEIGSCPGDFNRDGSVDGDDVIGFFGAWDSGDIAGDFTGDGSVDGDDVIGFFEAWDGGC